jgi:ABC-2 type transport system ATP-binding protein
MNIILSVRNLVKHYPSVKAVDGVSFDIPRGICFGLLGPNGAGKTTTIEMLEGIIKPTRGDILFAGEAIDGRYAQRIGIQFQHTALQDFLTVRECLTLFSRFYNQHADLDELIATCALEDFLERDNRKLSGGQKQRLLLAIALINNPDLVFLDEPTTGLDPQARHNFWMLIKKIKQQGKTIVLTTHYMDEAQTLCDEIVIMDKGRVLVSGTPTDLLESQFAGSMLSLPQRSGIALLENFPYELVPYQDKYEFVVDDVQKALSDLMARNISLEGLHIGKPNLEDLFLRLTGHSLRS